MKIFKKLLLSTLAAIFVLGAAGCSLFGCKHESLQYVAKTLPDTCQTEGNVEHYECEKCGKKFKDAEGKEALSDTDVIIPMSNDYCDYSEGIYCKYCHDRKPKTTEIVGHTYVCIEANPYCASGSISYDSLTEAQVNFINAVVQGEQNTLGYLYTFKQDGGLSRSQTYGNAGEYEEGCSYTVEGDAVSIVIPSATQTWKKDESSQEYTAKHAYTAEDFDGVPFVDGFYIEYVFEEWDWHRQWHNSPEIKENESFVSNGKCVSCQATVD